MKRHKLVTVAVIAAALLAIPSVYAAPTSISSPVHAMFSKTKISSVKFNLRNETGTPLEVLAGDKQMTLEPGKLVPLDLPVGTKIVANSATPNHAVGSLIEQVTKDHAGATITIH